MTRRVLFILFACFSSISVWACNQSDFPTNLLGEELNQIRQQFISVTYDGDFFDEFDNDKTDERWLVIDENRHYVTLHTVDGFISEVFISDNLYSTQKNIRVGDSFSKVYSAYPSVSFRVDKDVIASGIYDVVTEDQKITFWFDASEIRKMINEGKRVNLSDKIVQKMELSLIHIKK